MHQNNSFLEITLMGSAHTSHKATVGLHAVPRPPFVEIFRQTLRNRKTRGSHPSASCAEQKRSQPRSFACDNGSEWSARLCSPNHVGRTPEALNNNEPEPLQLPPTLPVHAVSDVIASSSAARKRQFFGKIVLGATTPVLDTHEVD